jgi:hypothetical protein
MKAFTINELFMLSDAMDHYINAIEIINSIPMSKELVEQLELAKQIRDRLLVDTENATGANGEEGIKEYSGHYMPEMLSNHTEEEMFEGQKLPDEKDSLSF